MAALANPLKKSGTLFSGARYVTISSFSCWYFRSSFEAMHFFICGRRIVAVARYWMIYLVLSSVPFLSLFFMNTFLAGMKQLASQFNFKYRSAMTYCPMSINNPDFENTIQGRCISLSLRSKQDGEQHFCFLLGVAPVDRGGRLTSNFPLRQP